MERGADKVMRRLRLWLIVMATGLGICAVTMWGSPNRIWPAYLVAFLASWLLSIGGTGLLALGNLTGGRWAVAARPFYSGITQTLALVAVLFIPIGVFVEQVYPWASDAAAADLQHPKAVYLDATFFRTRAIGYFAVWLVLSWLLVRVSRLDLPLASTPAMRRVGAIALVLLVPTSTFAAFDWAMSLEPEWYSSIYGALATAGGVMAAHALSIVGLVSAGDSTVDAIFCHAGDEVLPADQSERLGAEMITLNTESPPAVARRMADICNDLGSLLLAFLMVNTYFALSQFLIIWSANLPGEVTWYVRRFNGGWQWLALAIVLLHFFVPFLMLLSRSRKRAPLRLRRIAVLLVAMYLVHVYWMVVPAVPYSDATQHVANVAALAVVLGAWMSVYYWYANRALTQCIAVNSGPSIRS
jgi:hypothetical protein